MTSGEEHLGDLCVLVCSVQDVLRSEFAVAVGVFFLVLFLLWAAVDMWISRSHHVLAILLARPCEKIEHEAEAICAKGQREARHRDSPRLVFAWSTVKTGHYPGHYSESCKRGQVATKPTGEG